MTLPVVIAGASVAGVRVARTLRSLGVTDPVILLSDEDVAPYDRPPLSKQFLAGEWDHERIGLLTVDEAVDLDIDLRLGSAATAVDAASGTVSTSDGETIAYASLVACTGAAARPSPWGGPDGVHVVRTRDDAAALRKDLLRGGRVVVIGGGFIGAEVAATCHRLGLEVTVVDPLPSPMGRPLGEELGGLMSGLHERHGVATRFGASVTAIDGVRGDFVVSLDDGSTLGADLVVVGIGATPNDEWLRSSGLVVDDGLVCDEFCRAVGATNVFAAGDVARWWHPARGRTVRVEHWTNAIDQAECVAHNVAHPEDMRSYAPTAYIWSDQYDWKVQVAGDPHRGHALDLLEGPESDKPRLCALFATPDGEVTGAVAVNWPKALLICRRIISDGVGQADALSRLEALGASLVGTGRG